MALERLAWLVGGLALLGGCPPPHRTKPRLDDVRVVPGELDAKKLLAAPAKRAADAGAGVLTAIGARIVTDGEQLGSFVEIPAKDCALVLARAGKTVSDIDLFVYSDGGDRLASDEAPDSRAAVLVCPPHPRRVYAVVRSVSGEGMVALGVQRVAADKADEVAKALDVRGRPGQDTGKLAQWPGLERAIRERRASLGSKWEDMRRVAVPLSPNAYSSITFEVPERRCIDVLVVPSDEVQGVDAMVVDDGGRTVARGKPPGRSHGFILCADVPEKLTVMVRPRESSGLAAVVVGRSEPGAAADLAKAVWLAGATPLFPLEKAVARHAAAMKALRFAKVEELGTGTIAAGASSATPVELEAGCTRIDVIGGRPLGRFATELWTATGERLARARGGEHAAAFVCGKARKAQLEVRALDRAGPYAVQARVDDQAPELLTKYPIAASRLLSRLDAVAGPVDVQHGAAARHVRVSRDTRATERVKLPPNACTDIVVALDEGASEVSMAVALPTRAVKRSVGVGATHQRVCVGPGAHVAEVVMGVALGQSHALLLAR